MGAVGATFGRNLTPDFTQNMEEPNPIRVARALLDRALSKARDSRNLARMALSTSFSSPVSWLARSSRVSRATGRVS